MRGIFSLFFLLAMAGIARLFPYKKPENYVPPNYDALGRYTSWGRISGWIMLITVIALFYFLGGTLYNLKEQSVAGGHDVIYKVLPDRLYWIMIGFIFIIGISAFIYTILTKLYLGDDFRGFIDYSNSKSGYNAYKIVIPMGAVFSMLGLALLFFLWDYGIYMYKDKMVIHWYLSTNAKTYKYSDIKSIAYTKENHKHGASYNLIFNNGDYWDTQTGLNDENINEKMNFVIKQSGVKVDTLADDPK